ncbi:MAG: diaminobutyrate acetyltransferase [Micromonosporaceae bacterium]
MSPPEPSHTVGPAPTPETPAYEPPKPDDGAELWRMARDSQTLDLNSPYMYLLGASHFAETSVIARVAGRPVGFVWGYRRPDAPDTLFVWQVAVDPAYRGRRLAHGMLAALVDRLEPRYLEATVTPDNLASAALFTGFAQQAGAPLDTTQVLFDASHFPAGATHQLGATHQPEVLFRIGPLTS